MRKGKKSSDEHGQCGHEHCSHNHLEDYRLPETKFFADLFGAMNMNKKHSSRFNFWSQVTAKVETSFHHHPTMFENIPLKNFEYIPEKARKGVAHDAAREACLALLSGGNDYNLTSNEIGKLTSAFINTIVNKPSLFSNLVTSLSRVTQLPEGHPERKSPIGSGSDGTDFYMEADDMTDHIRNSNKYHEEVVLESGIQLNNDQEKSDGFNCLLTNITLYCMAMIQREARVIDRIAIEKFNFSQDSNRNNNDEEENKECSWCKMPSKYSCSQCKKVKYCGRDCQRSHWKNGHKQECEKRGDK
jgi:hypothetical protein